LQGHEIKHEIKKILSESPILPLHSSVIKLLIIKHGGADALNPKLTVAISGAAKRLSGSRLFINARPRKD
jgi:hypothetical protein